MAQELAFSPPASLQIGKGNIEMKMVRRRGGEAVKGRGVQLENSQEWVVSKDVQGHEKTLHDNLMFSVTLSGAREYVSTSKASGGRGRNGERERPVNRCRRENSRIWCKESIEDSNKGGREETQ